MITKEDIKRLNHIRAERKRYEQLDKELTAKLIDACDGKLENEWNGLSYKITEGKTTYPNRELIRTLDNWEQYYNTTTYPKLTIGTGK